MDFVIMKNKIKEMIENQRALQKYVETSNDMGMDALIDKYNTAIFVECGEAIQETNFKWWKTSNVNIPNLKEELADVFIFALDFAMIVNEEKEITNLLESNWIRIQANAETNFATMNTRLKTIGSPKYATDFKKNYGLFVMRGILDIIVLYGYMDFVGFIIAKQNKNINRQQNGYNGKTI